MTIGYLFGIYSDILLKKREGEGLTLTQQREKLNGLISTGQIMALEASKTKVHDYSFTLPKAEFETWMGEINTFNERYLKNHPQHNSIHTAFFHRKNLLDHCHQMVGLLKAVANDTDFWGECQVPTPNAIVENTNLQKEIEMTPIIFISHRTIDGPVADMLRDFLVGAGIPNECIFCSSLPGNDVKYNISREVKEKILHSTVNVAILSDEYYESAYCVNEAGIIWLHDQTPAIVIGLPEITPSNMQGFLNNDYKLRRLDNFNDISEIYDTVQGRISATKVSYSVLTAASQKLVERYTEYLEKRVASKQAQSHASVSIDEITTDDERVVLYYILDKKVRCVRKTDIIIWMTRNEIYGINIDNALDLLSSFGTGRYENGTLELDINVFRKYTATASDIIPLLKSTVERYQILAKNRFIELWDAGALSDIDKLFAGYIIQFRVTTLGDAWQMDSQIKHIQQWEDKYSLDDSLSSSYSRCLSLFADNRLIYESNWTDHGNVKEHTICPSLKNYLLDPSFPYMEEIESLMKAHYFQLPF